MLHLTLSPGALLLSHPLSALLARGLSLVCLFLNLCLHLLLSRSNHVLLPLRRFPSLWSHLNHGHLHPLQPLPCLFLPQQAAAREVRSVWERIPQISPFQVTAQLLLQPLPREFLWGSSALAASCR